MAANQRGERRRPCVIIRWCSNNRWKNGVIDEFLARQAKDITGVLHCLDRVNFHRHRPICYAEAIDRFRRAQGVRLEDFGHFVQRHSEDLRLAAEAYAKAEGRPCIYQKTYVRKEEWAERSRVGTASHRAWWPSFA